MWTPGKGLSYLILGLMLITQSFATAQANPANRVSEFKLANGLVVVVVPDTRAPVVTHMVYFRVGSADEPPGVSGIAHFLEHLMFKSTDKLADGEFSATVSRLGGTHNAFTSYDYTAYFERVAKDRLKDVMAMEADRMVNLRLSDQEVATERQVIIEERRVRTENIPSSILTEQMSAALYQNHPYRIPIIGWMHEMANLSREDALTFYKRFYAPNNAILVVTGDVNRPPRSRLLPTQPTASCPPIRRSGRRACARRSPPQHAARRVELKDPRAGNASVHRYYMAPALRQGRKPGEAEALDLLMKIAGRRLHEPPLSEAGRRGQDRLERGRRLFRLSPRQRGHRRCYAVAGRGRDLDKVEAGHRQRSGRACASTVSPSTSWSAPRSRSLPSSSTRSTTRRSSPAVTAGPGARPALEPIEGWPAAIAKVTADDVKTAAAKLSRCTPLGDRWRSSPMRPGPGIRRAAPPTPAPDESHGKTAMIFAAVPCARRPSARRSALGPAGARWSWPCALPHDAQPRQTP